MCVNISKLVQVLLLFVGVVASPLHAQDDANKSLGEKTSEGVEKAKDSTVKETHKVANTTRHETHKAANTVRQETGKKSDASSDSAQKTNNAATPH